MDDSTPELQFCFLQDAIAYIEENPISPDDDEIDVIEIPPKDGPLTDLKDFDDEVVDGGDQDPLFLPVGVPGSVELHQFSDNHVKSTDSSPTTGTALPEPKETQPKKKRKMQNVTWKKMQPKYSKLSPSSGGAAQKKEIMKTNCSIKTLWK